MGTTRGRRGGWPDTRRLVRGAAGDRKKALDALWPTKDPAAFAPTDGSAA